MRAAFEPLGLDFYLITDKIQRHKTKEDSKLKKGTLEANSLWYKYKTEVWLQRTGQKTVVHNIMRVLRSIRNLGRLAYVSVPITSSKFFYEFKLEHSQTTEEEFLERAMPEIVIPHNYIVGWNFVEELIKRIDCPILYPADLVPIDQQWEQSHFQAFWLSIIAEKCTEVHMAEGWEYSNGGSEEFTHVMQLKLGIPRHEKLVFFNTKEKEATERERMKNIVIYNHHGVPLSINDGIRAIGNGLSWLKGHNLSSNRLESCLDLLYWTRDILKGGFYQ